MRMQDTGTWPAFTSTSGADTPSQIVEVNGAGLALIDVDDDGNQELFIANGASLDAPEGGPGCALLSSFHGRGDITEAAGINLHRWATSATPFDLEGDGDSDLYVTCIGPDVMLRNDEGVFTDITASAGLGCDGWGTCAAAGDLDGDGWTDLYVVNYLHWDFDAPPPPPTRFMNTDVFAGPRGLAAEQDRVYLNNGDGTFRDVTTSSGLVALEPGYGLNALITDLDGNGTQDVLVGNDTTPNRLLCRAPGDTFTLVDRAAQVGLATNADGSAQATMGMALGDVNHDGLPDVFSTNFSSDTNTLHVSDDGFWVDRTQAFGLGLASRPFLGWTTWFHDLDLDGDEDLLVLNGHVYPGATMETMDSTWAQIPHVLLREGNRFALMPPDNGFTSEAVVARAGARGAVRSGDLSPSFALLPRQGDLRVTAPVTYTGARPTVITLHDDSSNVGNREGHGAHLAIDVDGMCHHRWITTSSPFQGADAPQAHLLLPAQGATCTVYWPAGTATVHPLPPGRTTLVRSEGRPVAAP